MCRREWLLALVAAILVTCAAGHVMEGEHELAAHIRASRQHSNHMADPHRPPKAPVSCYPDAVRLCAPGTRATTADSVPMARFYQCLVAKRRQLQRQCQGWVDEHLPCTEELTRLCPDLDWTATAGCMRKHEHAVAPACFRSAWFQTQFVENSGHTRTSSTRRRAYEDDDDEDHEGRALWRGRGPAGREHAGGPSTNAGREPVYVTPHDVHDDMSNADL